VRANHHGSELPALSMKDVHRNLCDKSRKLIVVENPQPMLLAIISFSC
jgi:hypothetical protein